MRFVADLHLHSKYSRAVSPNMVLEELDRWADDKGILVMGTGDFTFPAWIQELKTKLEPAEPGLYRLKKEFKRPTIKNTFADTRFLLSTEISSIYSRAGRTRRVHNIVLAPDLETVEKIHAILSRYGNLRSDGRPILGLDSEELLKIMLGINPDIAFIPAHCLLPETLIHTRDNLVKQIKDIKIGDLVFTHKNRWRKVSEVFTRSYRGETYRIQPYYFREGLTVTPEHPFYAIKTKKNCHWSKGICKPAHQDNPDCRARYYKSYKPDWIQARYLEKGDVLIFPRFKQVFDNHSAIVVEDIIDGSVEHVVDKVKLRGNRVNLINNVVPITQELCRLAGYYLAEGYTNGRDAIGFAFHSDEEEYLNDVITLVQNTFGFTGKIKIRLSPGQGKEIIFFSKVLQQLFGNLFYSHKPLNAGSKALPTWMLGLPLNLQVEIFKGWWRGDKGYTSSRFLMNQMKIILLRLGIVPSIYKESREGHLKRGGHHLGRREIKANYDCYAINHLSFFEDSFGLLKLPEFSRFETSSKVRHGWIDDDYVYLPIRDIEISRYDGEVYNLEVEDDNSYTTEFATVHNCWTPWFSVFGSMSGFDSLEECFGEHAKYIFAIETGLSSDPSMNWRLSKLDNIALVSNSDSHSPERIGREANVFDTELSYRGIIEAIKSNRPDKFLMTIEFFPEEGKYHFDGHRLCGVYWSPEETKKHEGRCTKCGRPVTVGVVNRVDKLADRPAGFKDPRRVPFVNLVTLDQIIGEAFQVGPKSKAVKTEYDSLIRAFGSELRILMEVPAEELAAKTQPAVAEGVKRMREGKIHIRPGYDGEYGEIKIFTDEDRAGVKPQATLF